MGTRRPRSASVDLCRIVAILAVFTDHFLGDYRDLLPGLPQLHGTAAAAGRGLGTWGVVVFVVISGVTLTWSWGGRDAPFAAYWRSRLRRIFPVFWWVAVPLTVLAALAGALLPADYWKVPIWWAGLSFVTPRTFWPVITAWWYIGLALQLYLVFPLLLWLLRRERGAVLLAAAAAAATLAYTLVPAFGGPLEPYLKTWLIGAAYVLPFSLGMIAGARGASARERPSVAEFAAAILVVTATLTWLAVTNPGWWLPVAAGAAAAAVVAPGHLPVTEGTRLHRAILWLGGLSFFFYLSHSPWAKPVIRLFEAAGLYSVAAMFLVSLACAFLVALVFWWSFGAMRRVVRRRRGPQTERG